MRSAEKHKKLARRLFDEVITGGNWTVADELIAPDCVDHNPFPGQGSGREGIKQFFQLMHDVFADWRVEVQDLFAEDDRVAARLRIRPTHRSEFLGVPATGRCIDIRVIDVLRFEDGRIVERWGERNDLEILHQLGALPTP